MTPNEVEQLLALQGVKGDPVHVAAAASGVSSMLEGTAERFAKLPLETEPANFPAQLRASAP